MQIVSGGRDRTIKLWNTIGECKYTIGEPDGHTEWVSCVRFSPVTQNPVIVFRGLGPACEGKPSNFSNACLEGRVCLVTPAGMWLFRDCMLGTK